MKILKNAVLALTMVLMPACGLPLVEFEMDAGLHDAGLPDSGMSDAGLPDGGSGGGLSDGGLSDGGLSDGGLFDGGLFDGGLSDGGLFDGGLSDGGLSDGGLSDGGLSDGGLSDGGLSDGGLSDAGLPDAGDVIAPTVISVLPRMGAMGVSLTATVNATFSEPMNASTLPLNFTLNQGATPITGAVTYSGNTATFTPGALMSNTTYTATVATGATDLAGNHLASNFVWSFTTGTTPDTTPPTVILTSPLDMATNVSINKHLTATFSESMDPTSISTTTFKLAQGLNPIAGTVTYDPVLAEATFVPTLPLTVGTTYTATITNAVRDVALNTMVSNYVWTFTTGACGQAPVVLGAAGNFVALAGSTVTNTGATSITGDLGVSPGSSVTGFPPGIIVGTQHVTDPTAAAAEFDLTVAYNDAAGRTLCPVTKIGNLGGQTLTPGLYKSTGAMSIDNGDLTLDAQGDSAAVFIFQIASTLSTTSGRKVFLIGGAKAANVFWQVGTSATFETTTAFQGTVMADQSITLRTGASLTGRALARIAAVNFDTNAVTKPAP